MSEKKTWSIGDVVILKSGGPPMTVVGQSGDSTRCMWFAGSAENTMLFPPETLVEPSRVQLASHKVPTSRVMEEIPRG